MGCFDAVGGIALNPDSAPANVLFARVDLALMAHFRKVDGHGKKESKKQKSQKSSSARSKNR